MPERRARAARGYAPASKTVARPEYRELAPIKSRDVLNGDDTQGNDRLERTNVSNGDIRWEWYPESGEVLSAAVFAKRFERPTIQLKVRR